MNRDRIYKFLILTGALLFGVYNVFYKPTNLGLDLKGGVSLLLSAHPMSGEKISLKTLDQLAEVMDRRVNSLGVSEPVIQTVGVDKISIEIPGVKDSEEALSIIGKTALLEFRLKELDGLGRALLTGRDLKKAEVTYSNGIPAVSLIFTTEGAKIFHSITRNNIGKQLAITLDGEIQSAPVIRGAIADGKAIISSDSFTFDEANKLVLLLNAGSLPVRVEIEETKVISATLGEIALAGSMKAALLAAILIALFMSLWYFIPGFLASISLSFFALVTLGVMNFLDATITLPGIAGFILSLGMAVDANVIIFEIIREELKRGSSIASAIKSGFDKSLTSIVDSNITTLIITGILFMLGRGAVRGYAVTLSIGVVMSMLSSIFVTKFLLEQFTIYFGISSDKFFGILNIKSNFDIVKRSGIIFFTSIVAIILSLTSLYYKGLNYGIDFTGGNILTLQFEDEVDRDRFSEIISDFDKDNGIKAQLQFSVDREGTANVVVLKTASLQEDDKGHLYSYIRRNYSKFRVESEENIGAVVGESLKKSAIYALMIASILIVLYISMRFKFTFAVAAIGALLHDVIISVGLVSYLGYEVNTTFIVAVLTILGYSINDTVVVFDRIRDKLSSKRSLKDVINKSVNQVFARSFNTSLTTLLSLLALLVYSVPSLETFLMTFLFGIIAGTYSSIFLASPFVYSISKE